MPEEKGSEEQAVERPETEEDKKEALNSIVASGKCGPKVNWSLDKAGTFKITGKGSMTGYNCEYSNETDAYVVDSPWFSRRKEIRKVIVSKGVTTVGSYAFRECSNLVSVSLPTSLKIIGNGAFGFCESITKISVPKTVTRIGEGAFSSDYKLVSINIPNGVKEISDYTFSFTALTNVVIPSSATSIGKYAFSGCKALKSIKIPSSVTHIDDRAFRNCTSLETVDIAFVGLDWIGTYAFQNCTGLKHFLVPLSVMYLDSQAFGGCDNLEEIEMSETLYNECKGLGYPFVAKAKVFHYLPAGQDFSDEQNAWYRVLNPEINGTGTVMLYTIPHDIEKVVIPNVVTGPEGVKYKVVSINPWAFRYHPNIKSVVIGSNVTSINDYSFENCINLVSVTGGAGLRSIGTRAFKGCTKLKTFNISSKVLKKIGAYAFQGDRYLKTLYLKKTTKLTKSGVKRSLKGSSVKTVKVKKSKLKKYKKYFKKKNCGKKVKVKK